jgi:hypothetical protein
MQGVSEVRYVSKDESLRRFRESFGDLADLTADLGANPLPASFEVVVAAGSDNARIAGDVSRAFASRDGVEEVRYDRAWLDRVDAMLRLARFGGAGLALVVFGAVAFVMASVLGLAVYARREEIDIMLLVGASPGFVRGPFLVAGLVQGLLASIASLVLVESLRRGAPLGWIAAGRPAAPDGGPSASSRFRAPPRRDRDRGRLARVVLRRAGSPFLGSRLAGIRVRPLVPRPVAEALFVPADHGADEPENHLSRRRNGMALRERLLAQATAKRQRVGAGGLRVLPGGLQNVESPP